MRNTILFYDWMHCEKQRAAVYCLAARAAMRRELFYQRGVSGLARFVRSYGRYSKARKGGRIGSCLRDRKDVAAIIKKFEQNKAVAIELRPTLDTSRKELQRKLIHIVKGYFQYLGQTDSESPAALGLTLSLFKQENLKKGTDYSDRSVWKIQSEIWARQVRGLLAIVEEIPALRYFIVGIDAAGQERGCPPRVFRRPFDLVRDYNRGHGRQLVFPGRKVDARWLKEEMKKNRRDLDDLFHFLNDESERRVPHSRLGFTFHAGEDFVDPMTGLRHIDECLEYLEFGRCDRIGHCLVAGLDENELIRLLNRRGKSPSEPAFETIEKGKKWRILKARGTLFLDLAWESAFARERDRPLVRALLCDAATRSFGVPAFFDRLAADLDSVSTFVRTGLRAHRYENPDGLDTCDKEWIYLDENWLDRFEHARKHVVKKLIARGVVVESCPTSNVAVAGLQGPPIANLLREKGLRCALATDDPGLMGAWPQHEYRFVKEVCGGNGEEGKKMVNRALRESKNAAFVRI